jgi:hypothetical protein
MKLPEDTDTRNPEQVELESKKTELEELEHRHSDLLGSFEQDREHAERAQIRFEDGCLHLIRLEERFKLWIALLEGDVDYSPESEVALELLGLEGHHRQSQSSDDGVKEREPEHKVHSENVRREWLGLVKQVHPDLGRDDSDRELRTRATQKLNEAYERGDVEAMRAAVEEYNSTPDAVTGDDLGSELIRVIRAIALTRRLISELEDSIAELHESTAFGMWTEMQDAELEGKDWITPYQLRILGRISETEAVLNILIAKAAKKND